MELDPLQKRRGRPPKYPKYDLPFVPKVHLTEKEILDSALAFLHNKCNENSKIINGFKKFLSSEFCPDDQCIYLGKDHYHCGRKFCHMSTDRLDILNLHAKDFHNNVTILEGFEFFERMVNCRRPICHNNRINRHFHCIRPRCDYSFVRHSTMAQHNKKHPTVTSAVLSAPVTRPTTVPLTAQTKVVSAQFVPIAPAVTFSKAATKATAPLLLAGSSSDYSTKTVVKSSGTFYPLSSLSQQRSFSTAPASSAQVLSSVTLAPVVATAAQVISGTQIVQNQCGTPVLTSGAVCLNLPSSIVSTSIPMFARPGKAQQDTMFAGIIPVEQLHQQKCSPSLVAAAGSQIITPPQGHILQQAGGIVQVFQKPSELDTNMSSLGTIPASGFRGRIPATTGGQPITVLLQHQQDIATPLSWANLKKRMHYCLELNCGRPFCKLKKKDHYHCLDCNQAFSDPTRLRTHIGKHGFRFRKSEKEAHVSECSPNTTTQSPVNLSVGSASKDGELSENDNVDDVLSSSLNLEPSVFTNMVTRTEFMEKKTLSSSVLNSNDKNVKKNVKKSLMALAEELDVTETSGNENNVDDDSLTGIIDIDISDSKDEGHANESSLTIDDSLDGSTESSLNTSSSSLTLCSALSRKSNRKRTSTKNDDFVHSDTLVLPKAPKVRKRNTSTKTEADLPDGYKRVRCGEDCGYVRCAYRQTVTHFHCLRKDCGYGFSDKSRIMQHRIRHERLDTLMGGEFQQFRASVSCERADCEFDEKASHFHCLKCPYSCADSSKVPAHRKYHIKLDNVSNNGFIKYTGTADCQIAACSYFRKQTHYHCVFPGCNHAVLGPSQMAPHKLKHAQHQSV